MLPIYTKKQLMKQNNDVFDNTTYLEQEDLVYHYGLIFPVLPMHFEAFGYIFRLPGIIKRC